MAIEVEPPDGADGAVAIEAGYAAMQRVSELMHPTESTSDLARIAAAPPGTFVPVDEWTLEVLRTSRELNRASLGAFDPCLAHAEGRMPDIELRSNGVVCRAPVAIDLGGIAKGFAVDLAVAQLQRLGCPSGLVNAGGDLRVFGPSREVYIRDALGGVVPVEMRDGALASSGPRTDASPSEHLGYYHGASGKVVDGRVITVAAAKAMVADALCKCALLCAPPLLAKLLDAYGARLIRAL